MQGQTLKLWNYESYANIPPDGKRYEVIDGELFVSPAPSSFHQTLSRRVQFALYEHIELAGRGHIFDAPIDVILSDIHIVQPDLALVLKNSMAKVVDRGIEGPPDLIVEILSPSTAKVDRSTKRSLYAASGVREYWLISPELEVVDVAISPESGLTQVTTFHASDTLSSTLLADFRLPLAPVFAAI